MKVRITHEFSDEQRRAVKKYLTGRKRPATREEVIRFVDEAVNARLEAVEGPQSDDQRRPAESLQSTRPLA